MAVCVLQENRLESIRIYNQKREIVVARVMMFSSVFALVISGFLYAKATGPVSQSTPRGDSQKAESEDIDAKLKKLGIELSPPSASIAIYKKIVIVNNIAYLSGHIPIDENGEIMKGKVGADVDVEKGAKAAGRCAIGLLSTLKGEIGSLNKVKRLIKTTGMVNCTDDFTQQPEVVNGCSQLIVDIWGDDNGKGVRAAVGMASLPRGAICEIEMMFELKE